MSAYGALLRGSWPSWPDWRCDAIRPETGQLCGLRATWQCLPLPHASQPRLYCDHCRPDGSTPIPPDSKYFVTRLDIRVALTGAPGSRSAAADEAVRRVLYGLEALGCAVLKLDIAGKAASSAGAEAPRLRLELAGNPQALAAPEPRQEAPIKPERKPRPFRRQA
jgi:hypothetical protein